MRYDTSKAQVHRLLCLCLQGIFNTLDKAGQLVEQTIEQLYSEAAGKFLADRFVTGTCPKCQFEVKMLPLLFFLLVQLSLSNSSCLLFFLFVQLGLLLYSSCLLFFLSYFLISLTGPKCQLKINVFLLHFFVALQLCCLIFFIHSLPTPLTYSVHSSSWSSSCQSMSSSQGLQQASCICAFKSTAADVSAKAHVF